MSQSHLDFCATADAFFFKYISANEVGLTGSHQAGFYMPKDSWRLFFEAPGVKGENKDLPIEIVWPDFITQSKFKWYGQGTRSEYRLTGGFQFLSEENVGDLLIIGKSSAGLKGYLLSTDESIDHFLESFGLTPEDSGKIQDPRANDENEFEEGLTPWLKSFAHQFPSSEVISTKARELVKPLLIPGFKASLTDINFDQLILHWIDTEFKLFKWIEKYRYRDYLNQPFSSVEELILTANTILNRRKSRAGYSLEHHLCAILNYLGINYSFQGTSEGEKKPDFLFPSMGAYEDTTHPVSGLRFLAVKTTCKDRWRQILTEANRIRIKHLFTLQKGISSNQLREMRDVNVRLVVPESYKRFFPLEDQEWILSLGDFLREAQDLPNHVKSKSSEYALF